MTERQPQADIPPPTWTQGSSRARWGAEEASPLRRFIGGSPAGVALKLLVLSFVVGAVLVWLHISPTDVFAEVQDLAERLWVLGLRSFRNFGTYIIAGAAIVIPVWLIVRLLSFRGR